MAQITWSHGTPTREDDVRNLEQDLSVELPSDYRRFAITQGGAHPEPDTITLSGGREVVLERLLRVDPKSEESVTRVAQLLGLRLANLLPFGRDPFGNLFCFERKGGSLAGIVFWDHESGTTTPIAPTFTRMVELLKPPVGRFE